MAKDSSLAGAAQSSLGLQPAPVPEQSANLHTCLLCRGQRHRRVFDEFEVDVLRCEDCGHVFSSFQADPHYDGFWGDEVADAEHFYWSRARARMHADFFRRFTDGKSGRLLDMGCGLGFFLRAADSNKRWQGYGCEISAPAVRYAREQLGLQDVLCSRLEDADFPRESFDIITMWDVIDHILRPDPVLRRCHDLLRAQGILFIRTPNVETQLLRARAKRLLLGVRPNLSYLLARDHCHQYSMESIRRLLARNGFTQVDFVHLRPIGATKPGRDVIVRIVKRTCFAVVRALDTVSRGRLNFDNLFVVARK